MPYAPIQIEAIYHWKIAGLSDAAFRLWVAGLCYAQAHLTDGWLPPRLEALGVRAAVKTVTELLDAHLWARADPDGYVIHDYLDWNKSREQTERDKLGARVRKARQRGGVSHAVTDAVSHATLSRGSHATTDSTTQTTQHSTAREEGAPAPPRPADPSTMVEETPTDAEALWHAWVDASTAHGIKESLICPPKVYSRVSDVLGLLSLDEARAALTEFWRSPHFDAKRHFAMFAANAGQLLAHARSGHAHPFGAVAPAKAARTSGNIAALSAFVARGRTGDVS